MYGRHRPRPPLGLIDWLAAEAPARGCAWDCGTGSGQAADFLAAHFDRVFATDASLAQVAARGRGIDGGPVFGVAFAEAPPFSTRTVDLITVSQALHWFDRGRFYREVRRVARPGAVLAAWTYGVLRVGPQVDRAVDALYARVAPDWPPERGHVDDGYQRIEFPFERLSPPAFTMEVEWAARDALAYLSTWSAVVRFRRRTGSDPVAAVAGEIESAWGPGRRVARWPLTVLAGRVGR